MTWRRSLLPSTKPFERTVQVMDVSVIRQLATVLPRPDPSKKSFAEGQAREPRWNRSDC
jgi:hypothetical protein